MLKLKITDYYDFLINTIDLKTELLLNNSKLNNNAQYNSSVNSERQTLIDAIKKVEKINLQQNFELLDYQEKEDKDDNLNRLLFKNKYCFFIEKCDKSLLDVYLVIAHEYMNKEQTEMYKEFFNFLNNKRTCYLDSKNIFFDLINLKKVFQIFLIDMK